METRYDEEMMANVAQLYYIDGLTQDAIAKQFKLSRYTVSMILSDARDYGIVEISIKNPRKYDTELADQMKATFGLSDCFVVPTSISSVDLLTKIVATQGASIAEQELSSDSSLGVAWGSTIYEFMLSFRNGACLHNINVVPLIGGTDSNSNEYQLNEMVRTFSDKLQGTPTFIHAPAYTESVQDRELYVKSTSMRNVLEKWSKLNAAIISVGSLPEYYGNRNNKLFYDPFSLKALFENNAANAVGDICGRRFNYMGDFLDDEHNRRLIAIEKPELDSINKVICIASGRHKVLSIIGALRTNTIDVMISDDNTVKTILEVAKS